MSVPACPDHVLRRIKSEYLEMPGLSLTLAQAQRLWGLDRETCEEALTTLVGSGFLTRTPASRFVMVGPSTQIRSWPGRDPVH
jgi:hypothetical protein